MDASTRNEEYELCTHADGFFIATFLAVHDAVVLLVLATAASGTTERVQAALQEVA